MTTLSTRTVFLYKRSQRGDLVVVFVSKLAKIGKGWGIILPREALEGADLNRATTLALRVEHGKIVVSRLNATTADPFTPLRRRIPRTLTDKQVGKILDQALRRVRHATPAQRRYRSTSDAQS
jgi:antitoxin component of MazEF toxin-antitoxin module